MKKIIIFIIIAITIAITATASIVISNITNNKNLRGSGKLITKTIEAPAFEKLHASRGVKVVITNKATDNITIEADDNIIEHVTVTTEDQKLRISIDNAINNLSNYKVTVVVPSNGAIRKLEASSAATIVSTNPLIADTFDIDASSAGSIQAAIKANKCSIEASSASKINLTMSVTECEVDLSSAAKIELSGTVGYLTIDASSAAKLSAEKLTAKQCDVSTSSGAKATVNCSEKLKAEASSGSKIVYTGDCTPSIRKSSGASISKQ